MKNHRRTLPEVEWKNPKNKKQYFGGSQPEEGYSDELLSDPSYKEKSVYVPDDIKKSINKWAKDMGLKKENKGPQVTLRIYDPSHPGFFKRVRLSEEYVVMTLGFDRSTLFEALGDLSLHEAIYNEHILFEGFMDNLRDTWEQVKKKGSELSNVVGLLNNLLTDPTKVEAAKEQAIGLASRKIKTIMKAPGVFPAVIKKIHEMDTAARSKSGWRGFLTAVTLLVFVEMAVDNVEKLTPEGLEQSIMGIADDVHKDIMSDSPANTVISWINYLGKISLKGMEIIGDLYRVLVRADKVTGGAGRPVLDS